MHGLIVGLRQVLDLKMVKSLDSRLTWDIIQYRGAKLAAKLVAKPAARAGAK